MKRQPLDLYDLRPEAMTAYLRYNGWHFNKALSDWAVKHMRTFNTATNSLEPIEAWSKDSVDDLLNRQGIKLENNTAYDYVYVCNMAVADFFRKSLQNDIALAQFIKDYVDDADQGDGFIMNRFYADMVRGGQPIPWDELI